ncbi:MAG: DMT family transporter [Gammaproteobacteria bacterium]|nr:DMT family transporter [Gammaproteobacteria bacterium]
MQTDYYRLALLLVLATSVANSGTGLIVRSMNSADGWQMIFWRSCFLALALCIVYVVQNGWRVRAAIRELRPWSLLGSVAIAAVNICFILSLTYTTVANTMFSMSGAPFFAALLGWMVLRETVARGLWIAMGVASVGMGVMLWDGLGAGTLLGNALAVTASFCFGTFVVILRKGRGVNMLPVVILGTALGGAYAGFMTGGTLSISWHDVGLLFLWGTLISGTVHATFTWASRYVPGAELTLLILIEFILSPMWVWLVIDERPSVATLIGGALVLASVASRAIASFWAESRQGS